MTSASDSPIHWSAAEIARRVAQRQISAVEVVQAHIARIEEVDPQLNAVVVPRFEEALRDAAAADERQARGQPLGPLHGVPITLKECFYLAGTPSSIGLDAPDHRRLIDCDGVITQRLKQAGAITLGKTNLPQLMIWHESDNPVYGRTNNPWDLERTPGGSTGGEGAIIAARGSPLGLGNDLGGSIRVPCHFCGIHGFKPTSLRLPRTGAMRTLHGFEAIVTQPGPMARDVEDLGLALGVLADNSDGEVLVDVAPSKLGDPTEVDIGRLKIAVWTDDGLFSPSPAIQRAVRDAAAALERRGAKVVEIDPLQICLPCSLHEMFDIYCGLIGADGGADGRRLARGSRLDWRVARLMWVAGLGPLSRTCLVAGLKLAGQEWMARIASSARPLSAADFWRLADHKSGFVAAALSNLREQRFDAMICPPHALPAMPHATGLDLLGAASYAFFFNLLGFPAGVVSTSRVREGEDADRPKSRDQALRQAQATDRGSVGLPVGVQVAALPWREDIVLAVMTALVAEFKDRPDYPGRTVVPALPPHPESH